MSGFNKFHELAADLPKRGEQIVQAYAGYWQSAAAQLAPVASIATSGYVGGDLKESVGHEIVGPHEAKVFATMEYAKYQEFGTQDMPAQPFMRPARNALAGPWKRDLKAILKP